MYLSMKWLSDYVDVDVTPKQFSEDLTMSGSKVEGYEVLKDEIKNVVVGKILSIEPHPDADKLVICMVDVGNDEPVQIVTGASNLKVGDLCPTALHKSKLPGGVNITKGKLRGVLSNGMLCSLTELNLKKEDFPYAIEDGIFVIEEECKPGDDIAEILGLDDTIVEFEITSNRGDCLSVIGLAREVAATYKIDMKKLIPEIKNAKEYDDEILKEVSVESDLCSFYSAKVIRDVKVEPSPKWMRERLRASGIRPINNIVDITNYVMLTYGSPMHAFDTSHVNGGKIKVRTAKNGELLTLLDGSEHKLKDTNLVIADDEKVIGVAGVMGGKHSGVSENTTSVVFESACFDAGSVRLTAKDLGTRSESSSRFEKGVDVNNCIPALDYACQLVEELGAGVVEEKTIVIDKSDRTKTEITLDDKWICKLLGIDVSKEDMIEILERLEFKYENGKVIVPSFRKDVEHKADIAEEIARFYGYNNIPNTVMKGVARASRTPYQQFEEKVLDTMTSSGSYEIKTYSFIDPTIYDKLEIPKDSDYRDFIKISNPLGAETSVMRTLTIPSMLNILAKNENFRNTGVNLFEIATEYVKKDGQELPDENDKLTIGLYGEVDPDKFTFGSGHVDKNQFYNFYHMKGIVEVMMKQLHIDNYKVVPSTDYVYMHPGRTADLIINNDLIGHFGQIHPKVAKNFGLKQEVIVGYFDMAKLFLYSVSDYEFRPLPKYPSIGRDLALVMDRDEPAKDVIDIFNDVAGDLLEKSYIFNVFEGGNVPEGKKSIAFSLVFRSHSETLTDTIVEEKINKIIDKLSDKGITLR